VDRRFHDRATEAEACGKRARSIAAQAGRHKPRLAEDDLFTFSVDKSVEEAKKGPRSCGEIAFLRLWSKNDTVVKVNKNNGLRFHFSSISQKRALPIVTERFFPRCAY
jgi:hypothetical protein